MMKISNSSVNNFLAIYFGAVFKFDSRQLEAFIVNGENELCIDYREFVNSQFINKIIDCDYADILRAYVIVNDYENTIIENINENYAFSLLRVYLEFIKTFSIIGLYIYFRFNVKLILTIDTDLISTINIYTGNSLVNKDEDFLLNSVLDLETKELSTFINLLNKYKISCSVSNTSIDFEYINRLHRFYLTGKEGVTFGD